MHEILSEFEKLEPWYRLLSYNSIITEYHPVKVKLNS